MSLIMNMKEEVMHLFLFFLYEFKLILLHDIAWLQVARMILQNLMDLG